MLGTDPKAGGRVLVEEAGAVAVGAEVSVASDTDPQAITANIIARQDAIKHRLTLMLQGKSYKISAITVPNSGLFSRDY